MEGRESSADATATPTSDDGARTARAAPSSSVTTSSSPPLPSHAREEDVLPYLQNAALEQQSAESGPLPIHRTAAELNALAGASAPSVRSTQQETKAASKGAPTGVSAHQAPLQFRPLHTLPYPQPPPIQAQERKREDVLPYLQNAALEQQSEAGEKPLPIQRTERNVSATGTATDGSAPIAPSGPRAAQSKPPPLTSGVVTAPTVSSTPSSGHFDASSSAAGATPSAHSVHSTYSGPHHISFTDEGSCVDHRTGNHHALDQQENHASISHHTVNSPHIFGAGVLESHAIHGLASADQHSLGHHIADAHPIVDSHARGGHGGLGEHDLGPSTGHYLPAFGEHATGGGLGRTATEYNFGPNGTGHAVTLPQTTARFGGAESLPNAPTGQAETTATAGVLRPKAVDQKDPSLFFLSLLLIIIPVLSLSPYWGYHAPSTVSAFMMDEFGISYLDLGLMFTLYSLPNLFMPFVAGSLIERWGISFSSLLFNIFCLLGNVLLAITYYMPGKPISLLLISRVIFGFGGEAIIMCQQVMLTRWFNGISLVLAAGFVQIFVLLAGSGGAFLFLPHFDEDGVNISLLHVLFVSFWGLVFNLFYITCEWKWTPWLLRKQISEPTAPSSTNPLPSLSATPTGEDTSSARPVSPEAPVLVESQPSSDARRTLLDGDGHAPTVDHTTTVTRNCSTDESVGNHHALTSHLNLAGAESCLSGDHVGIIGDHRVNNLSHHIGDAGPVQDSVQRTVVTSSTSSADDSWGYLRIEGQAQVFTSRGREIWENALLEGGGRIPLETQSAGRRIQIDYATVSTGAAQPQRTVPARQRLARFSPLSSSPEPARTSSLSSPILFYPRTFTSNLGEDVQNLPLVYWLVTAMLFCVAPILPAFTAFSPLFFQEKFGVGAVTSSRATSLVYCVSAGTPFAALVLAKLRVRSLVQLLTISGVAGFYLGFYFDYDDSFVMWFSTAGLGLLYCFVLANGYAWVELSVPDELLGSATTLSLVITNAGMALAPFLVGLLRELSSDFDSALLALLGFATVGFFFGSLVLVADIKERGVLLGAEPATEAELEESRRRRALKRSLAEAEKARLLQLERDKRLEREIETEIRREVEREVLGRRAERYRARYAITSSRPSSPSLASGRA